MDSIPKGRSAANPGKPPARPNLHDAADEPGQVHKINNRVYCQTPYALLAGSPPDPDGKAKPPYQILRGHLSVPAVWELRDLDSNRNPESRIADTVFDVTYRPGGQSGRSLSQADVSAADRDARDPTWPDSLGIRARTIKSQLAQVGQAVTAMAATLENDSGWGTGYACAGLIRMPDGTFAFLRPHGPAITATGFDPSLICRFPAGVGNLTAVRALSIDDPSSPESEAADLAAYLRILDLIPGQPEIALALLAQLAWAPFGCMPDLGSTAALLAGASGGLKTATAGVLIAAQSSTFTGGINIEPPVTAKMRHNQTTAFGADMVMHPLSGLLAVADDLFADQMNERELAEAWKRLSAMADNVATKSGGTRGGYGSGGPKMPFQPFPRSSVLVTAERLPNEEGHSSATARLAVFHLTADIDARVLTEVQGSARDTSRAHAALIRAGLPDLALPRAALAWGRSEAESWDLDGHKRVLTAYSRLGAGAYLLGERMRAVFEVDPALFLKEASSHLRTLAADQARRSGMRNGRDMARDPLGLFLRYLPDVLAGNPVWLVAPVPPDGQGRFTAPGYGAHAVGWRQAGGTGGMVPSGEGAPCGVVTAASDSGKGGRPPWRPVVAKIKATMWPVIHDAVNRQVIRETGWTIPADAEMRARLADAGYLQSATATPHDLWPHEKARCLMLDLARVLDPDASDGNDDDGPEAPPDAPVIPDPQGTLDGLPDPATSPAASGSPDPSTELPGAPKPCPGPCRGCGQLWEYGRGGWLCPDCQPGESGVPSAADPSAAPEVSMTFRPAGSQAEQWDTATAGAARVPAAPKRSRRKRQHAHSYGVLSPAGLHLTAETVPCPLPSSLADAYALAVQHDVRQLWITPAAAAVMGLPDLDGRPDGPVDSGTPHGWASLPASLKADPEGLAPWVTVWEAETSRSETGRSIVLPHLETRAAWAFDGNGEPWGPEVDGPVLLDAVTLLAGALGDTDYYRSPNTTTGQMARGLCRGLAPCAAVIGRQVPPVLRHSLLLSARWARPLAGPELTDTALIKLDRNAAYLSAMNTPLGVGEPQHLTGPVAFDPKVAGYYRLASQPAPYDALMPPWRAAPRGDGAIWVTRPDAELLASLGLLPPIAEAWVWPDSQRVLYPLYNRLRKAREALIPVKATPAGRIAWQTLGAMYKSFVGYLARTDGPRNDTDALYRPDYRDHIEAEAYARMFRNLIKARDASGRYPVAAHVDAAYFTTGETDPVKARPRGLTYGTGGGAWKDEGYSPLAALDLEHIQESFREVTGE